MQIFNNYNNYNTYNILLFDFFYFWIVSNFVLFLKFNWAPMQVPLFIITLFYPQKKVACKESFTCTPACTCECWNESKTKLKSLNSIIPMSKYYTIYIVISVDRITRQKLGQNVYMLNHYETEGVVLCQLRSFLGESYLSVGVEGNHGQQGRPVKDPPECSWKSRTSLLLQKCRGSLPMWTALK